jgi:hypothetical protein
VSTQRQIEENVKIEYDRQKFQQKITELQNDLDLLKQDYKELNDKYNQSLA